MDALDLLFRRLVLAARAAGRLDQPVAIGEMLDALAPYGAARRDGAFDSHDDYLHAMMRLLAGEREMVFADDLLVDDLRSELASPNPDLTVLRTYVATKVRLSSAQAQQVLAGDTAIDLRPPTPVAAAAVATARTSGALTAPRGVGTDVASPERQVAAAPEAAGHTASATGSDTATASEPAATAVAPGCPYCAQPLPEGRALKFCPTCGQNLLVRRCQGCSAEIEAGWKFCVTCGRKA